jgi:hypothetical protein
MREGAGASDLSDIFIVQWLDTNEGSGFLGLLEVRRADLGGGAVAHLEHSETDLGPRYLSAKNEQNQRYAG